MCKITPISFFNLISTNQHVTEWRNTLWHSKVIKSKQTSVFRADRRSFKSFCWAIIKPESTDQYLLLKRPSTSVPSSFTSVVLFSTSLSTTYHAQMQKLIITFAEICLGFSSKCSTNIIIIIVSKLTFQYYITTKDSRNWNYVIVCI